MTEPHDGDTPSLYYDMQALLSGGLPPAPQPTIGRRDDGHHIFYSDQVNLVFGDPETGKTWLCLWCAASKLINDSTSRVAVIDMDHNGPAATATRLLAFGAPTEVLADTNRFRYVEPDDRLHVGAVITDLATWRPDVVIVDSLGELMPLYGANSYSGDDFTVVNSLVLKPLARVGAAVLVIDHLSKGADSRNFGPVGTAAKRRAIGGVSLRVTVKDAFTPGSGGAAYLKINKDRHGGLRERCPTGDREPLAGTFTMRVFHDALTGDALTGEIKAPDGTEVLPDNHALGATTTRDVTADVDSLNGLQPPPQSVRDVCQRMSWGASRASDALKAWRESTGHTAPKNQHKVVAPTPAPSGNVALPDNGTPYSPVTAVTAQSADNETAIELGVHPKAAVTEGRSATATVTDLLAHKSHHPSHPKPSARKWLDNHIAELRAAGHTTAESFAVYAAGEAEDYPPAALRTAASNNPYIVQIDRTSRGSTWDITGTQPPAYRPAREWVDSYLDRLPADTTVIDREAMERAATAAGYKWHAVLQVIRSHRRIETTSTGSGTTSKQIWTLTPRPATEASA